ncbi:hypothetical protein SAMN02799624_04090 [Paenibacillus sp. UNC496MF]|uniref:hypothetical protein n=1 Tax=Paenibacillus sp. UNC496MF TaxID=1502753 RepID=UPI0008E946CC|nr:hypothetical protein [Paenibacillus sp. UNC496MF]SFJ32976.1 hypothetical protein SAMN02799624_04090 [Paenibacillus sp. UNC496MF]
MSGKRIQFKNVLVALLIIMLMLVCSLVLGQKDILFPEIAGMAMGVLAFPVADWIKRPLHLWLSPSLAAFLGTAMNDLNVSPLLKLWLCLIIIVMLMHLFRVHFGPTIPAGLLPFFLGMHDYVFAMTTTFFTFLIMLGALKMKKQEKLPNAPQVFRRKTDTLIISVILCLWIGFAFAAKIQVILVPPVFALVFEVFHAQKFAWRRIPTPLALVTLTAMLAVVVYHVFSGSILLAGVVNVLIAFLLCKLFKAPLPVAFGVSLMPLIFPAWGTWLFPVGVFITTGVLMGITAAYRQIRMIRIVADAK